MANARPYEFPDADQTNVDYYISVDQSGTTSQEKKLLSDLLNPIGAITFYAGSIGGLPNRWLICDGSEVNRVGYEELFAVIGTTFGNGDGSTTFNLPDMSGRTPIAATQDSNVATPNFNNGYGLGQQVGEDEHLLTKDEMPNHTHETLLNGASNDGNMPHDGTTRAARGWASGSSAYYDINQGQGLDEAHENRQPSIALYAIIKAI